MKRLYRILNIFLWCSIGVFLGNFIYKIYDYKTYQNLYELQSAPWYLGIQIQGLFTVIIVAIILIAMWIVKRKMK